MIQSSGLRKYAQLALLLAVFGLQLQGAALDKLTEEEATKDRAELRLAALDSSTVAEQTLVTKASEAPRPASAKLIGDLELRPSWTTKQGEFHSENTAELGYQFDPNRILQYTQYFNTNMFNPTAGSAAAQGLGLFANDGFLKLSLKNLWQSRSGDLSFSYANKLYAPTYGVRRDSGFITQTRNYLTLKQALSGHVTLIGSLAPTLFVYDRAGTSANGPNPIYETLCILELDVDVTKNLSVAFPVIYQGTRYRNFAAGAHLNDTWGNFLYIWPELDYQLTPNMVLGVSYYSDNLVNDGFSRLTLHNGLESGVAQMVMRASL